MHKPKDNKPKTATIIPDELKIILKTNVPGFQTISYRPNMTIPDEKSKSVEFNPLVKLKQSVITSVPEKVRIREFFDAGLFNSLIHSHGMQSVISLEEATFNGFVDNNISLTLKTIFPVKSAIYINNEPYSIADMTWTNSDWNINVKPKRMLDSSRVKDPYMYQELIQQEIEQGEKQLANLSSDVAYGDNYDGPKNPAVAQAAEPIPIEVIAEPIETAPDAPPEPSPTPEPSPPTEPSPPPVPEEEPSPTPIKPLPLPPVPDPSPTPLPLPPVPEVEPIEEPIKPLPLPPGPLPLPPGPLPLPPGPLPLPPGPLPLPPIPPDEDCPDLPAPAPRKKSIEKEKSNPVSEPILSYNKIRALQVRRLFQDNYYLINSIFKNLDAVSKKLILQNYVDSSKVKVKEGAENLSTAAYKQSVDGLKIVDNRGGGNCFFIAVADGINYYNYMNQNNKIKIGNYGSGELLITQLVVRQLTYDFVYNTFIKGKSQEEIDQYFEQAIIFVNDLNDVFEREINTVTRDATPGANKEVTTDEYEAIKTSVYANHPNYLVTYDPGIPKDTNNYYKPYRSVKKEEVKKYMLSSSYWADETAIEAIKHTLGLLVVPLETIDRNYNIDRIKLTRNWFLDEDWDKYMFLLHSPGHFELMQFTYQEAKAGKTKDKIFVPVKVTIFDRFRDIVTHPYSKYIPPIYILFVIFGGLYVSLNKQAKNSFSLLNQVFGSILLSFNKIKNSASSDEVRDVDKQKFITEFVKYFPETRSLFNENQLALIGGSDAHGPRHDEHTSEHNIRAISVNEAQICYAVTVQLMLKKGAAITDDDISALQCDRKRNAITKSVSTLIGKTFTMPPDYKNNMPSTFASSNHNKHSSHKKHSSHTKHKHGGTLKLTTVDRKRTRTAKHLTT